MKIGVIQRMKYLSMFQRYLKEYGHHYSDSSREFLMDNFLEITNPRKTPDILLQLYAKFGMLSEEENIYLGFTKMVGDIYGWDRKILEVGGGYYPIFSKYVDDKQSEIGKGTISVMDPKLVVQRLGNVTLHKSEFHRHLDVSDFNLLIGICPCEATSEIISSAVLNKKEFFIAMCGCPNIGYGDFMWALNRDFAYRMWVDEVTELAREQEEDGFDVNTKYVDNFPYPIIYSKRKK